MLPGGLIIVLGILAYTWLVYPVVVVWLGRRRGALPHGKAFPGESEADEDIRPTPGRDAAMLPRIDILFSAHNEEAVIEQRLANLAALDYPADRVCVCVGVDGGTDRTAERARAWAATHPNVSVVVAERNRGKTAMLKQLVGSLAASGPGVAGGTRLVPPALLVFTDANTMFERDALGRLVSPFADASIGGVCGRLLLEHREAGERGRPVPAGTPLLGGAGGEHKPLRARTDEPSYWDWEARLKDAESRLDSCLGANGAIYAIRPELFPRDIPDNTIVDDFVIGMRVRQQGQRMVFEPAAVAREELPPAVVDEWRRRVRIGAGAYQALGLCRACLGLRFGVFAWFFWSHKVLRWFTPHLLLVGLGIAAGWLGAVLGGLSSVRWPEWASLILVGLAVLGVLACRARTAWVRPLRLGVYFLTMQAALFVGFLKFCRGGLAGSWERTERANS